MNKRIGILALMIVALIGMAGCKKANGGNATTATASKDFVYSMEDIGEQGEKPVSQIITNGKSIYIYGYDWNDNGDSSSINFFKVNDNGGMDKVLSLETDSNTSLNSFVLDAEDNLYCIKNIYGPAEGESSDAEEAGDIDDYYLVKMKMSGEEIFSQKLTEIDALKKIKEENSYFYAGNIILGSNSQIYVNCMESYAAFDQDGKFIKLVSDANSKLSAATLIPLSNGKTAAIIYGETGMSIAYADMEQGTIGDKYEIPGVSYEYSFYPGVGFDLYMVNNYGVYGYNIGETDKKQLMSYIDSDFSFYNVYSVVGINEKDFYAMYDEEETGTSRMAKFTKIDPSDVKEKKIITLAMAYSDWNVRREVIAFNKTNEDYRISILDYSSLYGTDADYSAGVTRLNTDIVSGKIPDMILLDNSMPVDSYVNKGILEDFKPYIEKDEELDMNNFMPNVIEAFSKDGKLYSLVPFYSIQTIAAKTSDVGAERGWTIAEAKAVLESKAEKTEFLQSITQDMVLQYSMNMSSGQFVDLKTGECNFNSDAFIELLEFANSFPEEIEEGNYTEDYWNNYDSMWREGKVLCSVITLGDFRNYNYTEKGTFGEKMTLIGFPTNKGEGSVITPNIRLAMAAKSKNKDGAWQFLRTFLTDEYQSGDNAWGFPLSRKQLDVMGENAKQKPFYLDENDNKVEYDDTYYVGGVEIPIAPMSSEEVEAFKAQLLTFTEVYNENEALLGIIKEEAAPYFAGQKSAKDVADIIQSRAQIYVNENR